MTRALSTIAPPIKLTAREMDVLKFLAAGFGLKGTAQALKLSQNTIDVHRSNMMRKANVHSTIQMVIFALRKGLVKIEDLPEAPAKV
jgi:DNA-binding NarL/FixJ family response regulator